MRHPYEGEQAGKGWWGERGDKDEELVDWNEQSQSLVGSQKPSHLKREQGNVAKDE